MKFNIDYVHQFSQYSFIRALSLTEVRISSSDTVYFQFTDYIFPLLSPKQLSVFLFAKQLLPTEYLILTFSAANSNILK